MRCCIDEWLLLCFGGMVGLERVRARLTVSGRFLPVVGMQGVVHRMPGVIALVGLSGFSL